MRPRVRRLAECAVAGLVVTIGLLASPAYAVAQAPARPAPHFASASVTSVLPTPQVGQDTTAVVRIQGASSAAPVSVTWGDGSGRDSLRVACPRSTARRYPASCTAQFTHVYSRSGSFPIAVRDGRRVIARSAFVVQGGPGPWTPPAGWVQPAGWASYGSATFVPCSTVPWYYDRAMQPASGSTMYADVLAGLAMLSSETGLVFAETADPARARLTISWDDVDARYPGAAAYGGRKGETGFVVISRSNWWPTDEWPGFGIVTQPDGSYSVGRGWLIVHEAMHALGMAHVDDETAVMNPEAGATAFNAGDLDGLHTMYPRTACPA